MKPLLFLRTGLFGLLIGLAFLALASNALAQAQTTSAARQSASVQVERGLASRYAARFDGRRTASGERFNPKALTAAHKSLPFGTRVQVKSVKSGKVVVVRINDRGPFIKGRIIDLSPAAARALGLRGVMRVQIQRLQ